MAGQVGALRATYRVARLPPDPQVLHRLNQMARERLPDDLSRALAQLDGDGTIYVIRRVTAPTALTLPDASDSALSRHWATDIATAVARKVTTGATDARNLIRFDSQASFVAAFITDLLHGTAWQRWYYGPFAHHRHRTTNGAIRAVLIENGGILDDILADLAQHRRLELLVATLNDDAFDDGNVGTDHEPASERAAWEPLLSAALHVLTRLGANTSTTPALPQLVAHRVEAGARLPEWRDPAALAEAVADLVHWLRDSSWAPIPAALSGEQVAAAVADLDWLDRDRLASLLQPPPATTTRPAEHPRPATATPRQRDLLVALRRAVRERALSLDPTARRYANGLRLRAVLADLEPQWRNDPLVPPLIDRLLAAWEDLHGVARPDGVIAAHLRTETTAPSTPPKRTIDQESPTGGSTGGQASSLAITEFVRLGEPAQDLLAELANLSPTQGGGVFFSPVAGVLLLWRALLDTRLAGLSSQHRYPPRGPAFLVAEVGRRWAGSKANQDGLLDQAVRLLAGDGGPQTHEELLEAWNEVPVDAHADWVDTLTAVAEVHRVATRESATEAPQLTADLLVRVWARWLRGFERSSPHYLVRQFVRRPGEVRITAGQVTVRLERRPLDVVLEVAGYLRPLEPVPGLVPYRVDFELGEPR